MKKKTFEDEAKTFDAQMKVLKKAWKNFMDEVTKEIGKRLEGFLDKVLICGNCVRYDFKAVAWDGRKKTKTTAGYCKKKGYWVHRDCHVCRNFDLTKGPLVGVEKEGEKCQK